MHGATRRMAALVGLLAVAPALWAADDAKPLGSDHCDHTFARAGYPNQVSYLAQPSRTPSYCAYQVGGGCAVRGGTPGPAQGTFGYDYCRGPFCIPHHVALGWCINCRPKGGYANYKTDGPPVLNVLGLKLPEAEKGESEGHCAEASCSKH